MIVAPWAARDLARAGRDAPARRGRVGRRRIEGVASAQFFPFAFQGRDGLDFGHGRHGFDRMQDGPLASICHPHFVF
jgi:hypothetical protein